jgi:hypothetical protein
MRMNKATSPNGKWGLYDTVDDCWMAHPEEGPLRYDDFMLARLAAEILEVRFGWRARIRAREFPVGPMRIKDEVKPKISAVDAIERLERGTI